MTKTYNMVSLYNDVIENDKMLSIKLKRDVPMLDILLNYQTSLWQEVKVPAYLIGFIAAVISLSSAYGSKNNRIFMKDLKINQL